MTAVQKGFATLEEAEAAAQQMGVIPYHSFDITPKMREQIKTDGQPLYQIAPPVGVAICAGKMATDEEVPHYKKGGPVSMDAMRLAVWQSRQH